MPKISIIYKTIPQYRGRFFELLRSRLAELQIELVLIYGQPSYRDSLKKDCIELPWAINVQSLIFEIGGKDLYWQPALKYLENADLVIVEQANKLLLNYVLQLRNVVGIQKMAFWGHGRNLQAKHGDFFSEWAKRTLATQVHWWFAYDDLTAGYVRNLGYPPGRITCVQNAIDTRSLIRAFQNLSPADLSRAREELGIKGQHICIYAGGMYAEKRLNFLFEAVGLVRKDLPDFEMIFIGSGADAGLVDDFAAQHNWVHYVGPKFNGEKIPYFAISKLLLIPGAVGLGILDSFALETPLVTTKVSNHGPEIGYLENNINGIMVKESENPLAYANAILGLLSDETHRQLLIENCIRARDKYTVENMVENFAAGVVAALEN